MKIISRKMIDEHKEAVIDRINKWDTTDEVKRYLIFNFTMCSYLICTDIWNIIFTHESTDKCYRQKQNGVAVSKAEASIAYIAMEIACCVIK